MPYTRITAALLVALALGAAIHAGQPAIVTIQLKRQGTKQPVANASVELCPMDSDKWVKLVSDKHGRVVRAGLRPGMYQMRIECEGYRPLIIKGIELKDNDKRALDFDLPPAN